MANQEKTVEKHPGQQSFTWEMIGVAKPTKVVSPKDFAVWIRALLQNWRQGTLGVKGRADVALTGKKPWKQKGTGRARAGTARSPLWRGGGVTFGPQPRLKTLKVTAEKRKHILLSLLAAFLENNRIVLADWSLASEKPKTSEAFKLLKKLGLENKKVLLLLPLEDEVTTASFANIDNVQVAYFDQLNAYDFARNNVIVVLKKDLEQFKDMVKRWS